MKTANSKKYYSIIRSLHVLCLSFAVTACSILTSFNKAMPWFSGNQVQSIGLKATFEEQLLHAIPVDVVFVYDQNLITLFANADADQWFSEKQKYIASYGFDLDIIHSEIVPGQCMLITELPNNHSEAKAVFAFAYYPLNPNAKAVLTELTTPWLLLDAQSMQVTGEPQQH
jgi:hypothetical protein